MMNDNKINLYLHVGTGKTGTTAIQSTLKKNKAELEKQGYLYTGLFFEELDEGGKNVSPYTLYSQALRADGPQMERIVQNKVNHAVDYCNVRGLKNIIWSNESILDHRKKLGPILKRLSSSFNLKVIIYLRRQDQWFLSAYKQWGIKHKTYSGPVVSFKEWYEKRKHLGRYFDILREMEGYVGKSHMSVRVYEKCGDVVSDFCSIVGLSIGEHRGANRIYESPSNVSLALFKIYNSQFEEPKLPEDLAPLLSSAKIDVRDFTPTSAGIELPSEDAMDEILSEYVEQNNKLLRYSDDGYEIEFPEPCTGGSTSVNVEQSQINAALLFALVDLDKRLRNATNRIAELEDKLKSTSTDNCKSMESN